MYVIGVAYHMLNFFFFFFQAEDGIRDLTVTGVQTCALPISAADIAHEVGLGEVAQAAQDEQADQRERHPHDGARVLVGESAVAEFLGEQREARHGGGKQHPAEDPEQETSPMGAQVAEQAPVGPQRPAREGRCAPRSDTCAVCVVQGLPTASSLTVAILTSENPRRPSTSMAVMTDW